MNKKTVEVSKSKYLLKNLVLFALSSFVPKVLSFVLVPLYTNAMSTSDYGTADIITSTSNLLLFVATICISDAVLRFAIDGEKSRYGVLRYGVKVAMTGSAISGGVILIFACFNPLKWNIELYLFIIIILITSSLNSIATSYLRSIDKIYAVTINAIIITIVILLSNISLLLFFNLGIIGYLISFTLSNAVGTAYCFAIIYKHDKSCFKQKCDKQTKRQMVKYSFPLVFNGIAWWINGSLDRYCITFFYGTTVNGLYAVASKIPTILNIVNTVFSQAWNLSAIKEYGNKENTGFFKEIYSIYNLVLISSCSVLIMLNIPLARMLFAKDFFDAWKYSSILIISTVFSALSSFVGSIFTAVKKSKIFAVSTVIAAAINVTLNLILIPYFEAYGAAIATAISFFIVWMIRYICALKYIKLSVNIIRDIIAYLCIITQSIFDHFEGHFYLIQVIIFVVILLLYWKEMIKVVEKGKTLIKRFLKGNNNQIDNKDN